MSYLEMALKVSRKQQEESPAQEPSAKSRPPLRVDVWPSASLDAERRFGQPHAKLFPFLGRKVRTPIGVGTLIQVFADRCTDSQVSQCDRFPLVDIVPVSWEP